LERPLSRRHVALTLLVSVALVAGTVTPAFATGAAASDAHAVAAAVTVPPLPVEKALAQHPSASPDDTGASATDLVAPMPAPAVKFAAPSTKSSFSPFTSTAVSFGADNTVFKNIDGSFTKEVSQSPLNFKRADGSWVPVGTDVVAD
jgi:hypothetical protein